MIHNVTIPFSFDTGPIEDKIARVGEAEVSKAIGDSVTKAIEAHITSKYPKYTYGYSHSDDVNWGRYLKDEVYSWLDEHATEIIDEAAILLASRAGRRKAWRELIAELREGGELDG